MGRYSVVIPVYNEKDYILETLKKVDDISVAGWEPEVIVVDDGSTDGTRDILKDQVGRRRIIFLNKNQGKGAALRAGFAAATGEIIVIQDADQEYDPGEIPKIIAPLIAGQAQVVFGSRMIGHNPIGHLRYYLGNRLIALFMNIFFNSRLSDVETGTKAFFKNVLDQLVLCENRFGFEAEFTAKILKKKILIRELPISYRPRKFSQGKKIRWTDGLRAIWLIFKFRFF
jgi:glycosyltransferase involved in cell wall biosynthesis